MNKRLLALGLMLLTLFVVIPVAAQDAADAPFPVTIEHKFGSTTITAEPQRVVSIGYTDQDALLALGIKPVAVRYWYGDETNAIFPWAQDEADGAAPEVLNMPYGNLNYEAILALQPDLIIAVGAGITQEEYDLLTQIAPTVAQSGEFIDFGMPWQDTTLLIGAAVGKSKEAEALVSQVEGQFAEAREQNPQFEGKNVVVAYNYGEARTYGYYTAQDSRGRFFTDLGFVVPQELVDIAGESFYADISPERIDLFDQDLIVFLALQFSQGGREAIEADPLISQLNAVQDGRVVYVPQEYDDALQFSTVLSLGYALEGILPELTAAIPNDVAAAPVECEADFRAIEDAVGATVCVPEHPQRVVALMEADLDALLALGVTPIGTTNGRGQSTPPRYLQEYLSDITVVGDFYNPNLELVLGLDPDLILFGGFDDPEVLAQLNAIAPTINTFQNGESWKSHLLRVGTVMNMSDAAQAFITSYDERVQTIKDNLGDNAGAEFIVARWSAEGPQVMAPTTFSSGVLLDLGLTAPSEIPDLQVGHPHSEPLSLEAIGVLDVDWAFIGTLSAEGDAVTALDAAIANPIFQALTVVQNDHVVFVDGSLWTSIGGPIAATQVLDNVEASLVESE